MTTRDFLILVLKLFGLYSLVQFFFSTIGSLNFVIATGRAWWVDITPVVTAIVVLTLLFFFLVYRADWLVSKLGLAKGFSSDHISFNQFDPHALVMVACIIIGGLLVIDSVGNCIVYGYLAFRSRVTTLKGNAPAWNEPQNTAYFVICAIKVIVGYLLITNYEFVARRFVKKRDA
ncbi:hypothetical protein [Chryseolinea lacunae]|uniref:Uncharacterized protein n=1 Tax=Chryseolinea lacunae TaxID=2801331 RepID=A0ABS1KSH3_9BACT|nr:hypothetical protein [Chryseolinea lacunae]MBL0742428.1 hypothetical protein [Chryseolinea lacunae]